MSTLFYDRISITTLPATSCQKPCLFLFPDTVATARQTATRLLHSSWLQAPVARLPMLL